MSGWPSAAVRDTDSVNTTLATDWGAPCAAPFIAAIEPRLVPSSNTRPHSLAWASPIEPPTRRAYQGSFGLREGWRDQSHRGSGSHSLLRTTEPGSGRQSSRHVERLRRAPRRRLRPQREYHDCPPRAGRCSVEDALVVAVRKRQVKHAFVFDSSSQHRIGGPRHQNRGDVPRIRLGKEVGRSLGQAPGQRQTQLPAGRERSAT